MSSVGAALLVEFRRDPSGATSKNRLAVVERLNVSESSVRKASQAYRRGDIRECSTCAQEFLPFHRDQSTYCCLSCGRGRSAEARCEICGNDFVSKLSGSPPKRTRTCSRKCGSWYSACRSNNSGMVDPWGKCLTCGSLTYRRNRCDRCSLLLHLITLMKALAKARPRYCDHCGDPVAIGRIRTHCSKPECVRDYRHVRKHSRRLKTGRIKAESSSETSLRSIAERDGWRCHICKRAVRRKLGGQDRLAPSLDHLVPVSDPRTNRSYHSPEYLALAHKGCNSSLRDRGEFQLYLVSPPSREP